MSGKQEKKLRQLVRRNQTSLVDQSWDCFFQTISEMKLKYRIKLAWKIIRGENIRVEEERKNLEQEKEKLDRAFLGLNGKHKYFNDESEINAYLNGAKL